MKKKYLLVSLLSLVALAGVAYAWDIVNSLTVSQPNDTQQTPVSLKRIYHYRIALHGQAAGYSHTELIRNSDGWHLVDKYETTGFDGFIIPVDDNFSESDYTFRITNLSTETETIHADLAVELR